jgi:pSer/pThr/pTyr-binding forkhead associated (FHA) protein
MAIELVFEVCNGGGSSWVEKERRILHKSVYRIGRARECEICVTYCGAYLGREHCTLTKYDTGSWRGAIAYKLRDGTPGSPSRNGTYLNGARLNEKTELKDGDVITLIPGQLRARYVVTSKALNKSMDLTLH